MAAEPEIRAELRRLRARVPQLTGALAAGVDGLVLAHDTTGVEPEGVAALTSTALAVAVRMADATGRGAFRELLVRGAHGYVATYAAGEGAVLTVLAQDRVNVGRLHLEGRRSGARIGELVDAAAPPPAAPAAPAKPAPRTRRPSGATDTGDTTDTTDITDITDTAAARPRSARTARTTTANAPTTES
ncbi:roadblock/LC7 domain-containing protein [Streptomyces sp. NPDC088812]|uniref:roadblock/LC7 domain-containing protein n=1 Tax=Streptomyces sp. NPDC088812 TaxID=3365905 RepID=UPI003815C8BB